MDARLRNRGWLKLGLAVLITLVGGVIVAILLLSAADPKHPGSSVQVIEILLNLAVPAFMIWGNVDLANAKGHGSEVVVAIVVASIIFVGLAVFLGNLVLGLCFATALFLGMPVIILFGLDDKSRGGRHRRH